MVLLSKQIWICVKQHTSIFHDTVFLYSLTKTGQVTLVNETARECLPALDQVSMGSLASVSYLGRQKEMCETTLRNEDATLFSQFFTKNVLFYGK